MEPPKPDLLRRQALTNPAAEFVETGAGIEALLHLEDLPIALQGLQDEAEFVPEFGRFLPKGCVFE